MKKIQLWERPGFTEYEGWHIVVPAEEIIRGVFLDGYIFPEVSGDDEDNVVPLLNEKLRTLEEPLTWYEDVEDFVSQILGRKVEIKGVEGYISSESILVWVDGEFSNLLYWETVWYYEYWDGSNWRTLESEGGYAVTYDPKEKVSLDTFDGSNWSTGRRFCHHEFYPILELDGKKPEEPFYLLVEWTQYQGSLDAGKILTREELREHILSLGDRDPDEYLK